MIDRRFLTLAEVGEVLGISSSQTYALVRSGDLRSIKVGGRGQYRVEIAELDAYIARMYEETERFIAEHPFGADQPEAPARTPSGDATPR